MKKHTPGPWHRDGFNLSAIIRLVFPIGHPECKHIGGTYETIARCPGDNWDADSRLISAAPDMKEEMLQYEWPIAQYFDGNFTKEQAFDAITAHYANRIAVAKSEGK